LNDYDELVMVSSNDDNDGVALHVAGLLEAGVGMCGQRGILGIQREERALEDADRQTA
jgi:hypothetical protein